MSRPLVDIRRLVKIYRTGDIEVRALDGVDLQIAQGEFVAVMGSSGSGKSTLMNILGCLDRPTSGQYVLDGVDVATLSPDARAELRNEKIGFVFQSFNLLARTPALENVELPLLYGHGTIGQRERMARAQAALERVGLADRGHHHPAQLSGGQQQRVAIARALITDPSILLADEPTGNLDSRTSDDVMQLFQALNAAGKTVVVITHEPDVARWTRRVVVFRDGRVTEDRAGEGATPRAAAAGAARGTS
ncbi:MAG TPA: ABC transporter ATP-binding protein [Candidatus Polarisedimenticolaceae bacterium]|nr:ABC transporter ATP-binding protein [Candidatus Polarisedimenticolaceae bacterium]